MLSPVLRQRGDDLVKSITIDSVHGPTAIDADDVDLVLCWGLENRELAVYHCCAHVVAFALGDAL